MLLIQGDLSSSDPNKLKAALTAGNFDESTGHKSIDQVFFLELPAQRKAYFRAKLLTEKCSKGTTFSLQLYFLLEKVDLETLVYSQCYRAPRNKPSVFRKSITIAQIKKIASDTFMSSLEGVVSAQNSYVVLSRKEGAVKLGLPFAAASSNAAHVV